MAREEWSEGELINAAKPIPPMTFDCSDWESDIPTDRWSEGELVNAAKPIPPMTFDCSAWDSDVQPAWVAVQLAAAPADETARVVELLRSLAPELGLRHDAERSGDLATGRRVVAVMPTASLPDVEARLYALLPKVRQANSGLPIVNVGVEWSAA